MYHKISTHMACSFAA